MNIMEEPENFATEDVGKVKTFENAAVLPWGVPADRQQAVWSEDVTPGEFVLRTLFAEFTILAERKIDLVLGEPLERPLSKSLQRGEDPQFDQLLNSLHVVAEFSLSSLLKILFKWYEKQQNVKTGDSETDGHKGKHSTSKPKGGSDSPKLQSKLHKDRDHLTERRDLAVDFVLCQVLIEVLKQLPVHPVDDEHVQYIESLAFRHFKQRDSYPSSPSAANGHIIAALYAEVIGVVAQARLQSVCKQFLAEFKEQQSNPAILINLIYGMKYLRIKLYPVEELEEAFLFMRECATMFIDAKDKDVKHAFAAMFVEILVPVAASANRELNVPALKNFVDMTYHHAFDMVRKNKHSHSIFPLVTVLLCVSQKAFFLGNWPGFLSTCLATLKQRDVKMQKVALECLVRLVWVYTIRIKCESNTATVSRLRSIADTVFPRGSRTVIPREAPMIYFVKLIHFVAQEKLDFAMNDIVFDLLGVGRTSRQISPERMNIGLRAFFVIAESLQRKGGEAPPMPTTGGIILPSGNTVKTKKVTLLNLSESQATSIGLANYYHSIRKALDGIIRVLDAQVGKPMMMTNPHCSHKEPDDMITGERKPKIDLFRTCIAAIPRCIPEGMTKLELVELLSRLTVHMDEELRGLALFALQSLVLDFVEWRKLAVLGYVNFILREIQDNFPALLDSAMRMLLQLLSHWKTALSTGQGDKPGPDGTLELSAHALLSEKEVSAAAVLHSVEGCALVMLCSIRSVVRKLALIVLKEARTLFGLLDPEKTPEKPVLDVVDQVFPTVLEKSLQAVPQSEKLFPSPLGSADIMVVNDRLSGNTDKETGEQTNIALQSHFWSTVLAGLLEQGYLPELSPSAVQFSWPAVCNRLITVYSLFDQSVSGTDSITLSSMYRGPKKTMNMADLCLWRNYLVFACCTHPHSPPSRSESPDQDGGASSEGSETKGDSGPPSPSMVDSLFRIVVPLLKSDCLEVREAVIVGLGRTNPSSYKDFLDELNILLKEAMDRRAETGRKRRKREALRAYLARVLELNAMYGCFADSASELVTEDGLSPVFVEYIDSTRLYLEGESDKDLTAIMQLRVHFSTFIYKMITSVSEPLQKSLLSEDLRGNLFFLFSSWCAHFGVKALGLERAPLISSARSTDLELASLHAMCALLQCGPVFDANGLATDGYLYTWLQTVLNSPKEKISLLGHDTLVHLLLNNEHIPSLLTWVIDKCYTGSKLVMSRCFRALTAAFTERSDYPCELIPTLNVVLFKTADPSVDLREKAAHLLQLLERRFFPYSPPSISCSVHCSYSQSQTTLTQVLAKAHPEITIPMFEEMTSRFETTSAAGQRCILQYMLPWLANIELVDMFNPSPPVPAPEASTDPDDEPLETIQPVDLVGEGWGSVEASQIVLNNLFYITVKYDDCYSKEVEAAWTSLCSRWANNVHVLLSYVIAMAGVVGTSEVLIHAKKVAVYTARANTEKTVEELMEELKSTETVASQFDRCDEPPYFRAVQKTSSQDSVVESRKTPVTEHDGVTSKSDSHGKAKAAEEADGRKETREERVECKDDRKEKGDSLKRAGSLIPLEDADFLECCVPLAEPEDEDPMEELEESYEVYWAREWALLATRLAASGQAVPLPIPDEQRFYAPLPDVLPFAPTAASLYRCNFALMLLTGIVPDQTKVDWSQHLPLMLHLIFLALDHGKAVVYEHCKRLLVNLVVGLVCQGDHVDIAQSLYKFMTVSEQGLTKYGFHKSTWTLDAGSTVAGCRSADRSAGAVGSQSETETSPGDDVNVVSAGANKSSLAAGSGAEGQEEGKVDDAAAVEPSRTCPVEEVKALIDFLANSDCKPLWAFEDITPRSHKIRSAEQLEVFLASVVQIFQKSDAGAQVQEKLAKVALRWATSCSSRHYAGRSFQVFRALKVPLSWTMLSDVLSRLVESVGDASEDVQGYVMEILFTMEAAVDWTHDQSQQLLNPAGRDMDAPYDMPNRMEEEQDIENLRNELTTLSKSVGDKSTLSSDPWVKPLTSFHRHTRSLSSGCELKRNSAFLSHIGRINGHSQDLRTRSTSLMCLKTPSESLNPQSHADMSTRVFWIAASLLESDHEHEFLMAIVLINKVMTLMDWTKKESRERLEKVQQKLKWTGFPGLQALLLKGLTNAATSEPSLRLLAKLTVLSDISIVDPSQASGFALNVLALLPHMLEHFEEPDEFSKMAASNIVQVCKRSASLASLGKVVSMYVDKSYGRPCSTWVEVVCKYIHGSYGHQSRTHITFLLEVLERGPPSYQQAVLSVLCAMIPLTDFSSPSMRQFHNDTLRTISKYLKGNLWKESLDILKLAVSHSSNLDTPPPRPASTVLDNWITDPSQLKKELPGRTLDFTFELSATRVVGGCPTAPETPTGEFGKESKTSAADASGWRKPGLSQRRTRDRLVNVLTTCGHTVGLRQSPSVVFSSTSDLVVEKQAGQTSSEEASIAEGLNTDGAKDELEPQQIMGVMTQFDFLNEELLESNEELAFPSWSDEDRGPSFGDSLDVRSIDKATLQDMGSFSGSETDVTPRESSDDEDERLTNCTSESLPRATAEAAECPAVICEDASVVKIEVYAGEDEKTEEKTQESKSPSVTSTESLPVPSRSGAGESYDLFHVTEYVCSAGDVESLWAAHVPDVLRDNTGVTAVNTFSLFSCLYKVTRRKFYSLTRESCNYLDERFRPVSQLFSDSMEYLVTRGDCPYVSLDTETISQTKLLERHKFLVLELHSHLTNYMEKYEYTIECLDDIKLALKRSSVGSHSEEPEPRRAMEPEDLDQKHLQLCRCLYRAHFQFVLVCITYSRLLEALVQAAAAAKVSDFTHDATTVRRRISTVLEHAPTEDIDVDAMNFDSPVTQVMEKLGEKETEQAVRLMRAFRLKLNGGGVFGTADEDDVDTLVAFYCRHVSEKNVGALVMSSPVQGFSTLCSDLMEISVTILNALKDSGL